MDPRTARKLIERLDALERRTPAIRLGVITDTSPLSVALGGSDTPYTDVKAIAGVALAVDDVVSVIRFGADLLILGKLGGGSLIQAKRVATGSIPDATTQAVAVTWDTAFDDTDYTVVAMIEDENARLRVLSMDTKTAAGVHVQLRNDSGSSSSGTVHCIAVHD